MNPRLESCAIALGLAWCVAALTGCVVMREHPYATATVVALAAGSIAASQNHDNRTSPRAMSTIGTPSCTAGTCQ